jgi:hypothetical protein
MMRLRWNQLLALTAALVAVGCESKNDKRPPEAPDNTDHVSYANEYPAEVDAVTGDIDDGKAKAAEQCGKFAGYADEIKEPTDYGKVSDVVEASAQSGKSGEYARRARENRAMDRMLAEDDGAFGRQISGSVHAAATQDNCPNPNTVSGAASGGLKRGAEKRSEERLRAANEGHRVIERHKDALGKTNTATLEKQADDIAYASYVAHVELPELKYELERLIAQNDAVIRTVDREIEEEKKLQAEASDADKKASEERVKKLEETKQKLADQKAKLDERKAQLADLDKEIKQVQKDCDAALQALEDELKKRGGGAKAEAKAEKK